MDVERIAIDMDMLNDINRYWQPRFYFFFETPMVVRRKYLDNFVSVISWGRLCADWSPNALDAKARDESMCRLRGHMNAWLYALSMTKEGKGETSIPEFVEKKKRIRDALRTQSLESAYSVLREYAYKEAVDIYIKALEKGVPANDLFAL